MEPSPDAARRCEFEAVGVDDDCSKLCQLGGDRVEGIFESFRCGCYVGSQQQHRVWIAYCVRGFAFTRCCGILDVGFRPQKLIGLQTRSGTVLRMHVRIEQNDSVFTVILDRPTRRNAVDRHTATELADAFRAFEASETARVGVLYGDHNMFCSGADLKAIAAGAANRLEADGDAPMGPTRMVLTKPVIAAIAGHAVAGGLELALWCDLRVVEENAVMGVYCRRWGVPLIDGGTVRLPRLIGLSRALDLILTGRAVDAHEALSIGLANRVVPPGTSRAAAESIARDIARFPQMCMRSDRMSAYEQSDLTFADAMSNEFTHGRKNFTDEGIAGATRFANGTGRHGNFNG
jgi:enoyl-CoA hydratase